MAYSLAKSKFHSEFHSRLDIYFIWIFYVYSILLSRGKCEIFEMFERNLRRVGQRWAILNSESFVQAHRSKVTGVAVYRRASVKELDDIAKCAFIEIIFAGESLARPCCIFKWITSPTRFRFRANDFRHVNVFRALRIVRSWTVRRSWFMPLFIIVLKHSRLRRYLRELPRIQMI